MSSDTHQPPSAEFAEAVYKAFQEFVDSSNWQRSFEVLEARRDVLLPIEARLLLIKYLAEADHKDTRQRFALHLTLLEIAATDGIAAARGLVDEALRREQRDNSGSYAAMQSSIITSSGYGAPAGSPSSPPPVTSQSGGSSALDEILRQLPPEEREQVLRNLGAASDFDASETSAAVQDSDPGQSQEFNSDADVSLRGFDSDAATGYYSDATREFDSDAPISKEGIVSMWPRHPLPDITNLMGKGDARADILSYLERDESLRLKWQLDMGRAGKAPRNDSGGSGGDRSESYDPNYDSYIESFRSRPHTADPYVTGPLPEAHPPSDSGESADQRESPDAADERQPEDVHFTAYHPRIIAADVHYTLAVYTHLGAELARVRRDVARFSDEMNNEPHETRSAEAQPLLRGVELTVVPECEGITFNPEHVTFKWIKDRERVTFDFVADERLVGTAVNAEVSIYAGPLIIGILHLPLICERREAPVETGDDIASTTRMIRSVFASYSSDDVAIVEACRYAYKALGLRVLIDRHTLDPGDEWGPAIDAMIARADVFQLFWSSRSAQSQYVRHEWEYALQLERGIGFIVPVFWEKPRIPAPTELRTLHFKYVPLARLEEAPQTHASATADVATQAQAAASPLARVPTGQPEPPGGDDATPNAERPARRGLFGIFKRRRR